MVYRDDKMMFYDRPYQRKDNDNDNDNDNRFNRKWLVVVTKVFIKDPHQSIKCECHAYGQ